METRKGECAATDPGEVAKLSGKVSNCVAKVLRKANVEKTDGRGPRTSIAEQSISMNDTCIFLLRCVNAGTSMRNAQQT